MHYGLLKVCSECKGFSINLANILISWFSLWYNLLWALPVNLGKLVTIVSGENRLWHRELQIAGNLMDFSAPYSVSFVRRINDPNWEDLKVQPFAGIKSSALSPIVFQILMLTWLRDKVQNNISSTSYTVVSCSIHYTIQIVVCSTLSSLTILSTFYLLMSSRLYLHRQSFWKNFLMRVE